MGGEFLDSLKNIGVFILCAQCLMHFTAGKAYEKYVKLLIGIMVLAQFTVQARAVFLGADNAGLWEEIERFQRELESAAQEAGRDAAASFGQGKGGNEQGEAGAGRGAQGWEGAEGVLEGGRGGAGIWRTEKKALEDEIKGRLDGIAASYGMAVDEVELREEPPEIAVTVSRRAAKGGEAEENGEIRIDKIIIGKSEGQDIADMEMPENSAEDAGELAEAFAKALGTYADYIKVTVLPAEAERG